MGAVLACALLHVFLILAGIHTDDERVLGQLLEEALLRWTVNVEIQGLGVVAEEQDETDQGGK